MSWMNNGNTAKSEAEITAFVQKVIESPDFKKEDLDSFDAHRENQRFNKAVSQSNLKSQFMEVSVNILVPSGNAMVLPQPFTVPGLLHRDLTATIVDAFSDPLAHLLHFLPFKLFHHDATKQKDDWVHRELYISDAFLAEQEKVQRYGKLPADDLDCKREKVVTALMFSSDATHLTDFGNAKAWPIYLMLRNLSKYFRSQLNSGQCIILHTFHRYPTHFKTLPPIFTQNVWKAILDDDFINAYHYGIVIKCIDSVERRIYPQFFTYSVDYPEKCSNLGEYSGLNAFVDCLGPKFNPSQMLVIDLLHEFELGVWKALFTHLIHLLHAAGCGSDDLVVQLDRRDISTFGHGTICKFAVNSSEIKKLAAQDFEDLLQCALPAFEELPREIAACNRRQTSQQAAMSSAIPRSMSTANSNVPPPSNVLSPTPSLPPIAATPPVPLPTAAASMSIPEGQPPAASTPASGTNRKCKGLNLFIVKFHFLSDYVRHIHLFGMTDSYSTQLGELAHQLVKRLYSLTNKKEAIKQISKKYTWQRVFRQAEKKEEEEADQPEHLSEHHIISRSRNSPLNVFTFAQDGDPAKKC
ncbi:hypothetical protein BDZ97DRAFT_1926897 [Flammula alnicola]|nr:hypothetical protein BDZ97DRAFT_1926897 [Flammula alnicola]